MKPRGDVARSIPPWLPKLDAGPGTRVFPAISEAELFRGYSRAGDVADARDAMSDLEARQREAAAREEAVS